ncbi:MAG: family 78 glycoside hydrolase catalytic domain [Alistipes sp.]
MTYKNFPHALCFLLFCLLLPRLGYGRDAAIVQMRCEYLSAPICIDSPSPRFTWRYVAADDFVQSGCRLRVATIPEGLSTPDVWDSGAMTSARSLVEMPDKGNLTPRTSYYWQVEAWNADGSQRLRSSVGRFETAMMRTEAWQAMWISDAHDRDFAPAPMLRRAFEVASQVASARLYLSAAAYAKVGLNGSAVGDELLNPGYTHYDKRNLYSVYDVTSQLREGENVLSAVLGNGFYNEIQPVATWSFEQARWRARACMICELHITYADGTTQCVCSDDQWRTTAEGPYRSNNIYSGELYDARKEIRGWDRPDFDDTAWPHATKVAAPSPLLRAQAMPAVRATREIEPVAVRSFGDTVYVFDFGVNITGLCRLAVEGDAGTQLSFVHGEFLDPDGRLEMRNLTIYYKPLPGYPFQTDSYILSGRGRETWTPDFSYHGFRYVQLTASAPVKLNKKSLTARFMHTDVEPVGTFGCSNQMLNTLWQMSRQTYLNNLTSIPTDCPTREKNGWTADAFLALDLALLNYDGLTFYEKWLDDFVDNQTAEGRLAGIIPTAGWGYDDWIGPVWDAAAFIIPHTLYNYYGDLRPIEKMWPVCERYLDYLATREQADGGVTYGIGDWVFLRTQTPTDFTSTCYYYYDNYLMGEFARLLGRDDRRYVRKAQQLRELINTKYFDAATGLYANGSQAAQGVALYLGIAPDEQAQRVADNLDRMIVANNYFLDFGTLGSKTVLRMLTRYGHVDTAYRMASQKVAPSWGWWVTQGFTSLPETWLLSPEWRDASTNHVFLGDVSAWFVNDLVGINFDAASPGFSHIRFAPHFVAGLDWAKASYRSVHGLVGCEWWRSGDQVKLTITVPANTTATLSVEGHAALEVGGGKHKFVF